MTNVKFQLLGQTIKPSHIINAIMQADRAGVDVTAVVLYPIQHSTLGCPTTFYDPRGSFPVLKLVDDGMKADHFYLECDRDFGELPREPRPDVRSDTPSSDSSLRLTAAEVAKLVEEKQAAYGDSFGKAGSVLQLLYPNGIAHEQFPDALTVVRVVDKLFRIATRKDAFGESPWNDIMGYALLASTRDKNVAPVSKLPIKPDSGI